MATKIRATVDDVLRLSALGKRYELIDEELVLMSPTGAEHGGVEGQVCVVLSLHVTPRKLGRVFVGEVLFRLDAQGTLARAPDIAFVRRDRLRGIDLTGPFIGAPDLAVEIVSPGQSAKDLQRKIDTWLANGTQVVLVIYPESQRVVLWREHGAVSLKGDDTVDLDPALPDFRCPVHDLFPPPLEEVDSPGDDDRSGSTE